MWLGTGRDRAPAGESSTTTGHTAERPFPRTRATSNDTTGAPCGDVVALGTVQGEALAAQVDGVDAQVHQHPDAVGGEHDERVRVDLHEVARDGGDDRDDPGAVGRLDRGAGPDELLREHRVRHAGQADDRARDRRDDRDARSQEVLDVVGERVGLGADDDLHHAAGDDARRARRPSSAPPR